MSVMTHIAPPVLWLCSYSHIITRVVVNGDSTQLCRLADILLDNAMKYSYPNTTVTVSLKKHRDYCIFSVSSHGDTISRSDLKNIFKRFYRVDKTRSRETGGSGLGLAIVKNIILMHKGTIKLFSRVEEGSMFTVKIPLSFIVDQTFTE